MVCKLQGLAAPLFGRKAQIQARGAWACGLVEFKGRSMRCRAAAVCRAVLFFRSSSRQEQDFAREFVAADKKYLETVTSHSYRSARVLTVVFLRNIGRTNKQSQFEKVCRDKEPDCNSRLPNANGVQLGRRTDRQQMHARSQYGCTNASQLHVRGVRIESRNHVVRSNVGERVRLCARLALTRLSHTRLGQLIARSFATPPSKLHSHLTPTCADLRFIPQSDKRRVRASCERSR